MSTLFKSSLFSTALVAVLAASGREAGAQAPTYVGTYAMTNGASIKCLTRQVGGGGNIEEDVTSPWAANPAQEWAFLLLPNGYYAIFNVQNTKFLTTTGGGGGLVGVTQTVWSAKVSQMWYLYPLGGHFYALVNV